jgi:citrate lyase subunit beta / citryl-CoA lyase
MTCPSDGEPLALTQAGPSWLFCPADRPDRFAEAAAAADVVVLDLEDGVAPADKDTARAALIGTPLDPARTVVRINPAGTAAYSSDLAAMAQTAYTTVMLAKCEAPQQVAELAPLDVVVLVETPRGAINVVELVRSDNVVAVMWGAEDLFAALGGTAPRRADRTLRDVVQHVRSASLLAAKAYGRLALDSGYLDIEDLEGLRAEVDDAVAVGFDAIAAIHPSPVPIIRAGYTPSVAQLGWARRVLDTASNQRGTFTVDGGMVDAPVLQRAKRIVQLVDRSPDQPRAARSGERGHFQ